jgi:hypothetical protein
MFSWFERPPDIPGGHHSIVSCVLAQLWERHTATCVHTVPLLTNTLINPAMQDSSSLTFLCDHHCTHMLALFCSIAVHASCPNHISSATCFGRVRVLGSKLITSLVSRLLHVHLYRRERFLEIKKDLDWSSTTIQTKTETALHDPSLHRTSPTRRFPAHNEGLYISGWSGARKRTKTPTTFCHG